MSTSTRSPARRSVPQETLTAHGLISLVRRVNSIGSGPHTSRPFDAVVTTGDNTDNKEFAELDWFLTSLNGGTVVANTGAKDRYEGVQNSGADLYWNPESPMLDMYKKAGFPEIPDFFGAAFTPVSSPRPEHPLVLRVRQPRRLGVRHGAQRHPAARSDVHGISQIRGARFTGAGQADRRRHQVRSQCDTRNPVRLHDAAAPGHPPTRRARRSHRDSSSPHILIPRTPVPAPVGHGFAPDAGETGIGYYSFEIAPGVVGISMDSTNRAGLVDGSLGAAQFQWIENTLRAGSSTYYDAAGSRVTESRGDTYFVLFSHHTSDTMDNLIPDPPENVLEPRLRGSQLLDLLHRFPNVLAWVNGHTHENKITRGPARPPRAGLLGDQHRLAHRLPATRTHHRDRGQP